MIRIAKSSLSSLLTIITFLFAASAHAGWQQTFADEFDGTAVDTSVWKTIDNYGRTNRLVTGELQCYSQSLATVDNGILSLTAQPGFPVEGCSSDTGNIQYVSGQLTTTGGFRQRYGYFEVRAKMPKGQGLWPEFRVADAGNGNFLHPSEIVVDATYGSASQAIQQFNEVDDNTGMYIVNSQVQTPAVDVTADFHTYGVDWQPDVIVWYMDGVEVRRLSRTGVFGVQDGYLILNLAVGGREAGDPDATSVFPSSMQVDYVHVYARVSDGTPDVLPPGAVPPPPPPPPADDKAPRVKIILPKNGMKVKRKSVMLLAALAKDDVKVTSLTFSVNGQDICTTHHALEVCLWRVPADKNVTDYEITATATDAAGNQGTDSVMIKAK